MAFHNSNAQFEGGKVVGPMPDLASDWRSPGPSHLESSYCENTKFSYRSETNGQSLFSNIGPIVFPGVGVDNRLFSN